MSRPNVIFPFSDQQMAGSLGCTRSRVVMTPALGRQAVEGTSGATATEVLRRLDAPQRARVEGPPVEESTHTSFILPYFVFRP